MTQRINVQLNEKDVRKDLASILTDMDQIRKESLAERAVRKKQEYQSLAYRLASCFKGLYHEGFQPQIKAIEDSVSADDRLGNYDRLQVQYWSALEEGKQFMQSLAGLSLAFFEPHDFVQFFEQTGEYHLFQALNTLAKKDALPVQKGLPLETVLSSVPIEKMNDPQALVEAYQYCGYLTAQLKSLQAGNHAQKLQRHGFDARPDNNTITIMYKELPTDQFLHLVFGYKSIKKIASYYTARTEQGQVLLHPEGRIVQASGEEYFNRVAEIDVNGTKLLEIQNRGKFAYLTNEGLMFNRWFDQQLTPETMKTIEGVYAKHGEELATWLLNSTLPLEIVGEVQEESIQLLYKAKVRPTRLLSTHAPTLTSRVDNVAEFVRMYEQIQAVELPGKQSFWEMLDLLPEEAAKECLDNAVEAYTIHGTKLSRMLELYQERRTTHQDLLTLSQSVQDYISAIGVKF